MTPILKRLLRITAALAVCLTLSDCKLAVSNLQIVNDLSFSLPAGLYTSTAHPAGLFVSLLSDYPIRFTTDGSIPTMSSALYDGTPVEIPVPAAGALPNAVVVKACTEHNGKLTEPAVQTYIMNADTTLGVFSISTDPANLWSSEKGIFEPGNLYKDFKNEAYVEYFDEGGHRALDLPISITAFGAASRNNNVKSMAIKADGKFQYDFFNKQDHSGRRITSFESLILRDSGNDYDNTMIRDDFMTGLLDGNDVTDGLDIEHQASRPVVVYLNGAYWGFYSLREKVDEDYIFANWPSTSDYAVDLLTFWDAVCGNRDNFSDLMNFVGASDLSIQDNYNKVADRIDISNFIDYQIFNIYVDNKDWPGNNIKFWRSWKPGSKWRWIAYDTDFGYGLTDYWYGLPAGSYNTAAFALQDDGPGWPNPPEATLLLRKLLENPGFKSRFYTRFNTLLSGRFSPSRATERLNATAAGVADEIKNRHLLRWNIPDGIWGWNSDMPSRQAQWDANIEWMRQFAANRPGYLHTYFDGWASAVPLSRGTGNGLRGTYFPSMDLTGGSTIRTDPEVNFDWTYNEPLPGFSTTGFSVRWTGQLQSSFTGPVTLYLTANDGIRLWLNGTNLIDNWSSAQWGKNASVDLTLVAGTKYPITIEYYQDYGDATIRLEWSYKLFRETIPQSQLYNP